jgi:hypothetical protein
MYHRRKKMTQEKEQQVETILEALRRHPRVVHQKMAADATQQQQLRASMPFFLPFEAPSFHGFIPVLDWDHKLPSRVGILRVYAYYSELTYRAGLAEFTAREEQIEAQDEFPEFDVPDFVGLTADEAYEGDVEPSGKVQQIRLVSAWRRDISHSDARVAVQVARRSEEFRQVASKAKRRPDYLGDLEAVSWTPPCESAYAKWTIDVWYLMDLDAAMGKGRSFLVDLKLKQVVGVREFVVRSG